MRRPVKIFFIFSKLKLFRIIDKYRKMILLKRKNVNTKKGYNLTFLRNVRTILLRFGGKKVLFIVIMRTFPNFMKVLIFTKF